MIFFDYKRKLNHEESIKIGEERVRKNINNIDWVNIWWQQKFSESFMRQFLHKINWSDVSQYQALSEEFIREFADKVHWFYI